MVTSVRFCLSKFVYFNEHLLCRDGRRHDVTLFRRLVVIIRDYHTELWLSPEVSTRDPNISHETPLSAMSFSSRADNGRGLILKAKSNSAL